MAIPSNGVVTWNLIEIQNESSTTQICIILNEMNDCFGIAIDFVSQNTSGVRHHDLGPSMMPALVLARRTDLAAFNFFFAF